MRAKNITLKKDLTQAQEDVRSYADQLLRNSSYEVKGFKQSNKIYTSADNRIKIPDAAVAVSETHAPTTHGGSSETRNVTEMNKTAMSEDNIARQIQFQNRADTGLLDRHMMQEMFFGCVEGLLKKKQRKTHNQLSKNSTARKQYRYGKNRIFLMDCEETGLLAQAEPEINFIRQRFDHFSESDRQQVMVDFISNKAVLTALFDMMFQERTSMRPKKLNEDLDRVRRQEATRTDLQQRGWQSPLPQNRSDLTRLRSTGIRNADLAETQPIRLDFSTIPILAEQKLSSQDNSGSGLVLGSGNQEVRSAAGSFAHF